MVAQCTCTPNDHASADQSSNTNWGPLSEVISDGVLKQATQEERDTCATLNLVVGDIGTASGYLMVRSTIVIRCVKPCEEGPTRSTCTWLTCLARIGNCLGGSLVCSWTLACWHATCSRPPLDVLADPRPEKLQSYQLHRCQNSRM